MTRYFTKEDIYIAKRHIKKMLSIISYQGNAKLNHSDILLPSIRMVIIKNTVNNRKKIVNCTSSQLKTFVHQMTQDREKNPQNSRRYLQIIDMIGDSIQNIFFKNSFNTKQHKKQSNSKIGKGLE